MITEGQPTERADANLPLSFEQIYETVGLVCLELMREESSGTRSLWDTEVLEASPSERPGEGNVRKSRVGKTWLTCSMC